MLSNKSLVKIKAIPAFTAGMAFIAENEMSYFINFNSLIILVPPPSLSMHHST